jgi:hypothetical protein
LGLPARRHIPGAGTEPDRAPLEAAKALVRRPVVADGWEANEPYRYGAALCLNGFFWEAHEVWEAVWLACPPNSRERRLLRALIQVANAALKLAMGRANAGRRLLAEAEELIGECRTAGVETSFMGLDLRTLKRAVAEAAQAARGEERPNVSALMRPLGTLAKGWTLREHAL